MTVENAKQLFDETVCPTTKTKCLNGDQSVWKTSDDFSNKFEHYLSTHVPARLLYMIEWLVYCCPLKEEMSTMSSLIRGEGILSKRMYAKPLEKAVSCQWSEKTVTDKVCVL